MAPADSGSVGVNVPATAKPGSYTVTATCTSQPETASGTFRVPVIVTPTTPPPPVTTKPPVTTTPPKTTPTKPPVTTPTTPTSTTPTSETPVTSETPTTTVSTPADGVLVLDHPTIQPGDTLSATGNGCEPGHSVTLTSNGDKVGSTVADATGHFKSPVEFTRIEAGTHTVTADCGIKLTGAVEQVVTSSSGGHTGTLVLLVFFVLAGAAAIRVP